MNELTEREKFIAHYLSVIVVGVMSKQSDSIIDTTIEKLKSTRSRKLSDDEASQIIRLLNEEFLITGSLLSTINGAIRDGYPEKD
jgi:ribosomal protein S13|tara:strand:- start:10003 stop:10257 length:255 start_codon:yes stop_codon:yes gene_type:complete